VSFGPLDRLADWQKERVRAATAFYRQMAPLLRDGRSRRLGPPVLSYSRPEGWQCVVVLSRDSGDAVAVVHGFGDVGSTLELEIPMLASADLTAWFGETALAVRKQGARVLLDGTGPFCGAVLSFTGRPCT